MSKIKGSSIKTMTPVAIKDGNKWEYGTLRRSGRLLTFSTVSGGRELEADERYDVSYDPDAVSAVGVRRCGSPEHPEDEPRYRLITKTGGANCPACRSRYRKRTKTLRAVAERAGISTREVVRHRREREREERIAAMTRRHQEARERSAREHFAVVARNTLYGISSGVEVNPDGSLTTSTGFPKIGQNTPMRGPLAQRRLFALAQFTAACTDHGYTVEQAAGFLGVEDVEPVSWKRYRQTFPLKREYDEQEQDAAA